MGAIQGPPGTDGWLKPVYDPVDKKILVYFTDPPCCGGVFSNAIFGYAVGTNTWTRLWSHNTVLSYDSPIAIASITRSANIATVVLSDHFTNMDSSWVGYPMLVYGVSDSANFPEAVRTIARVTDDEHFTLNWAGSNASSGGGYMVGPADMPNAPTDNHDYGVVAWDSIRNVMYKGFGAGAVGSGSAPDADLDDLYKFDTRTNPGTWTQLCGEYTLPACGPGRLLEAAATYDAKNDVFVLYGGEFSGNSVADTWTYQPANNTWTKICGSGMTACGLPALNREGLVALGGNGKVLLYGGQTIGSGDRNQTWILTLASATSGTWTQIKPAVNPPADDFPVIDYVPRLGDVILIGKEPGGGHTWEFNPTTGQWADLNITPGPTLVAANSQVYAGAYDANADRFVVFTNIGFPGPAAWSLALPASIGANPAVSLSTTSLTFAAEPVGTKSASQQITVISAGTAPVTLNSIGISGTNAADFAQTNTCPISPASLAAGATCTIGVSFTASVAAAESASLSISDNANGSPQSVALSGSGSSTGGSGGSGTGGQVLANIDVQTSDWTGDVALPAGPRTNAPVTFGLPVADVAGISATLGSSPAQLALQDSSGNALKAQFRVLGRWNSGNAKWVLVDAQLPRYTEGTTNTTLHLVQVPSGGGNSPATAMGTQCTGAGTPISACPDANHIIVQTGVAVFSIKEKNYNLFDDVQVGSTHLVSASNHGQNDGLVLMGPRAGLTVPDSVSCPGGPPPSSDGTAEPCDNAYRSNNDAASICSFDDNGPLRTTVKCAGDLKDSGGTVYMHWTTRTTFWVNHGDVKLEAILRNADASLGSSSFSSAFKEYASLTARLTMNLAAGSRTVAFATSGGTRPETLSGTDSASLYEAYENWENYGDYSGSLPCSTTVSSYCTYDPIKVTNSSIPKTYAQNGYQVVLNGAQVASGTNTQVPPGWADDVDASSNGVEVGVYQFGAYWPKSLQFSSGGGEVDIGIDPDQALFLPNPTSPQSYAQWWPGWHITDLYFDFHTGALASQSEPFLEAEHALIARASTVGYYNAAKDATTGMDALLSDIPDPTVEDTYFSKLGVFCSPSTIGSCLPDAGIGGSTAPQMAAFYFWVWPAGGGGNQSEWGLGFLRNWLQRGLTGRYVMAGNFYRYLAEEAVPHSDSPGGFRARCPASQNCMNSGLDEWGYPGGVTSINRTRMDWADEANGMQHAHVYGEIDWYHLTGDETIKDHILAAYKDLTLNPLIPFNNPAYSYAPGHNNINSERAIGHLLRLYSRFSIFLRSLGDPDEDSAATATVLRGMDNVFAYGIEPPLISSGFPIGQTDLTHCDDDTSLAANSAACSQGVSPVRGSPYVGDYNQCGAPGGAAPCNDGQNRVDKSFMTAILSQGLYEYYWAFVNARGYGDWQSINNERFDEQTVLGYLYAVSLANISENFNDAAGVNTSLSSQGFDYVTYLDYLNTTPPCTAGDCSHTCQPSGCAQQTVWPPLSGVAFVTGTTADLNQASRQAAFDIAAEQLPRFWSSLASDSEPTEWESEVMEGAVDAVIAHNPSNPNDYSTGSTVPDLAKVPLAGQTVCVGPSSGSSTCTITWNAPANLTTVRNSTYQLRYWSCPTGGTDCPATGKQIVGWLAFHPNCLTTSTLPECTGGTGNVANNPCAGGYDATDRSGCWEAASDPRTHANWFEAVPVPDGQANNTPLTSASTSFAFTASAGQTYTFDLRAWETAVPAGGGGGGGGGGGTSLPSIGITAPAFGATVSGSVILAATASSSIGIASVQFQVDGSSLGPAITAAPYSTTWNTAAASNGTHTVAAIATDTAGRTSSASVTVQVSNSIANPTVSITSPYFGEIISGSIILAATASSSIGIASVQFQVDGSSLGPAVTAAPYSTTWKTTAASNGTHTVAAIATDTAGNTSSASVTVQVNNSTANPTVSITSPASGATVSGSVTLAASAASSIGIAGVQFQVDGSNVSARVAASPYSTTWNTTAASNGSHTVAAIATDTAGHTSSASVTVQVNNSTANPTVSITSPASGATVSGSATLAASAASSIGIASVQFQVDGSNVSAPIAASPYSTTWNTTAASNGSHTVAAIATDTAGRTNSATLAFLVSNSTPPPVSPPAAGTMGGATLDGNTQFLVRAETLASALGFCDGCRFSGPADLIPGQHVEIRLRPGSAAPFADAAVLTLGALSGAVTGVGANQFTLKPAPGSPAPASLLVLAPANVTVFQGFSPGHGSVQIGQTVTVRGLLFKSGPQGGPTLLAGTVVLWP